MHNLKLFWFFLLSVNVKVSGAQESNILPYKSLSNCKKNEYYDLDNFQCVNCDVKMNLEPSNDRFQCTCLPSTNTEILYDTILRQPICKEKCPTCPKSFQPKCKFKYINATPSSATQKTAVQISLETSGSCVCNISTNTQYQNYCISDQLLKDFQHYNAFSYRRVFDNLKFIAFFCKVLRNSTACNHLANLCVTSFYSLDKNSPCSHFYISQASDTAVYGGDEMDDVRPFIFYKKGKATIHDLEKVIDFPYSLINANAGSLQFFATIYSLDGRLLRVGSLLPSNVNLCNHNVLSSYKTFKFADKFNIYCKFTLDNILEISETQANKYFFSVFLNYTIDNVRYVLPVPILVRNAFTNNESDNPEDWQLVKRFLLYDLEIKINGEAVPPNFEDSTKLWRYKTVRFVDSFKIYCTIKDGNRISTPIITLHYNTINILRNNSLTRDYDYNFKVIFTKNHNLDFYFELLFPLTTAIALAFAILRTINFKARQNKEYYDFTALLEFVLYLCSSVANAFFTVASFICLYAFFVYSSQRIVKLLMPIEHHVFIEVLLGVAFVLKAFYFAFHYWRIAHIDIFFIDWERPKGYDGHSTIKTNLDTPSVSSSTRSLICDAVSAWRNFFVANEWIKISTKRKTSIYIQNISVVVLLEIMKRKFPEYTEDDTLQLAILLLLQVSLYIIQLTIKFVILERIYGNPLQQFIDICSTANVSVFILLHDSFGYYLHGRSPHGFSDTDMSSMIIQLQREANTACGKRGLLTGSDNQTYVILAPMNLRAYYLKLLTPFQSAASISQAHFEKEFINTKNFDYSLERTAVAYSSVNRFFCAFIDHAIKDLDYIIKERTFVEHILDSEFDNYLSETKGTFYIDNSHSFGQVLLYGNDGHQFLFDLMLFCCAVIVTNCPIASAFITIVLYKIFQLIFRSSVKNNVSNKTLIDKRFLM